MILKIIIANKIFKLIKQLNSTDKTKINSECNIELDKEVYLNSIDELVRLQADMDEVFSAILDKSKKTFIEHIDAGLAFKFKRRPDNGDLIFSVQGDYELLDDYIFTNCRES